MLSVSPQWSEAIQAQFRYPAYLRFTLAIIPPGLIKNMAISTTDTEPITNVEQIKDGKLADRLPAATFEPNRWVGDGSMYLLSSDPTQNSELEWWSNTCEFTSVKLTFSFDKPYTIPGVHAVWDTETKSWPTKLVITGYKNDGSVSATHTITSITSERGFFDAPIADAQRIEIDIKEWSKPGWRVRINEILFGVLVSFDNNKIAEATMNSSAQLMSDKLPTLDMQIKVNNYDKAFDPYLRTGYSKYLSERQRVNVQWGFEVQSGRIEWMNTIPLYLSTWSIPSDDPKVTLNMTSRNTFLTDEYNLAVYTGHPRTFREVANAVLRNSNIMIAADDTEPWELDPIFDTLETRAPEPREAVNVIIQLLANAACCMFDNDPRNNYLRVRKMRTPTQYSVSKSQQLGDPKFGINDRLKRIIIGLRTFKNKSAAEEVYNFDGKLTGTTTVYADFNNNSIVLTPKVTITGATLVTAKYFARRAELTVKAKPNKNVTITITGVVVEESTTFVETYNDVTIPSGLEVTIDNPFITEVSTLNYVAEQAKNFYLRRHHTTVEYTGYPELEVGDTVHVSTTYGESTADIRETHIKYNGGFTGTLELLGQEVT